MKAAKKGWLLSVFTAVLRLAMAVPALAAPGSKWYARDKDGVWHDDEPGLACWKIELQVPKADEPGEMVWTTMDPTLTSATSAKPKRWADRIYPWLVDPVRSVSPGVFF